MQITVGHEYFHGIQWGYRKSTSGSKNLDTDDIKKNAPNIVDGISKLKEWSTTL